MQLAAEEEEKVFVFPIIYLSPSKTNRPQPLVLYMSNSSHDVQPQRVGFSLVQVARIHLFSQPCGAVICGC